MKEYKHKHGYNLIDAYVFPDNIDEWSKCPVCGLRPKVWKYDNGRSTGCGCHNSMYDHRAIVVESIMSVYKRTGATAEYDSDGLRKQWNLFCLTGVEPKLDDGMW